MTSGDPAPHSLQSGIGRKEDAYQSRGRKLLDSCLFQARESCAPLRPGLEDHFLRLLREREFLEASSATGNNLLMLSGDILPRA